MSSNEEQNPDKSDFFGPALPPHLLSKNNSNKVYGPTIEDFCESEKKESSEDDLKQNTRALIGPEIPAFLQSSHPSPETKEKIQVPVDDVFGPSTSLMTSEQAASTYYSNNSLPKISTQDTNETIVKRETWMTELPEKKRTNFGLLARHFSTRVPTDKECDDSVWTETPGDKKKKESHKKKDHKEILKIERLKERDKEMERLAKKAAKKLRKKESLMEMHLRSMRKKKKEESKKMEKEGKTVPERRPFDRNVDLQIRKIDENQRRAILNKSQFLNDRFAAGQSRFL